MRDEERKRKLEETEDLNEYRREVSRRQKLTTEQSEEVANKPSVNATAPKAKIVRRKPGLKGIQVRRKPSKPTEPAEGKHAKTQEGTA